MWADTKVMQCTRCHFSWLDEKRNCPVCENAAMRDAALTLGATGTVLLRDHAMLLPPENAKWEAACGKLNRVLEAHS